MPRETRDAAKQRVLHQVFGFNTFRPGQETVVDALLDGRHVLAVMPTGSGKSLCYQVPALVEDGLTIVVSPLLALMEDQIAALRLAGVAAETINSGRSRDDNVAVWRRVSLGETKILYLSPERLMSERMLSALGKLPVRLIAIDEAHCISQWGPAFRPDYEALTQLPRLFPEAAVGAFTATADEVTRADIVAKLFGGDALLHVTGFDRPNIQLVVERRRDRKKQMIDFLAAHRGESGIVYCLSRAKCEEMARMLSDNGVRALPYHAGMDAEVRVRNQGIFLAEPGVVMVATIAFGMGIDKSDVRFVFHADIPGSLEAYYQEIGRAGRDGQPAVAHMLYGLDDIRMRRQFIEQEDSGDERKRREHKRLDALIGYCEAPECRRRPLLAYFGEDSEPCGNCDVCRDPIPLADGSAEARLAMAAIIGTGERFGSAHLIDVLRGSASEKVARFGHDTIRAFGIGKAHSVDAWRSMLRQMIAAGFLELDVGGYGGITISAPGRDLLRGEGTFRYRPDTVAGNSKRRAKTAEAATDWTDDEAELLGRLKELRRSLAVERRVPAYVVFTDKSLEDMIRRRPTSRAEFGEVSGVGAAKLRDFADFFLAVLMDGAPANR